jgi:hypothetical protein
VTADAGGEVVDVEEPLEQVGVLHLVLQLVEDGDLAVHQRLEAPGEVDEHLELLFAARLAGELRGLDDGADGAVVRTVQVGGEEFEVVGALGGAAALTGRRAELRRSVAAAQRLDQGAQVGLAPCGGAAQDTDAVVHGPGGPVGGHRGDDDADEGHRDRPGEHGPQHRPRPRSGGPDGEEDGGTAAEGDGRGRQHGQTQQLGPYMGLGQRGCGAGGRPPVPPAFTAVGACGRGAEVRHRCPRTGPSGLGARGACGGTTGLTGSLPRTPGRQPGLPPLPPGTTASGVRALPGAGGGHHGGARTGVGRARAAGIPLASTPSSALRLHVPVPTPLIRLFPDGH